MLDLTSIVLATATVVAVLITRGRERRDEIAHGNSQVAELVRHALLGFTDIDDVLDLRRPDPVRPPWSLLLELLARLVGLRVYTAQLVLYEPHGPDNPRVFQTSGAASSADSFFNLMTADFASVNVCIVPDGTNTRSLDWHDPDGGCIVWVTQTYTRFDWMPRRKPKASPRVAKRQPRPGGRWALRLVVATATAGFGLTLLGGWVALAGAGMMLLATAGALATRRAKPKCPHRQTKPGGRRPCRGSGQTQQRAAAVPAHDAKSPKPASARCSGTNRVRCDTEQG